MKKLIIAAAAVMLGIAANASSAIWSVDYTYKSGTDTAAEGWAMYFFDNGDMARNAFIASLTDGSYVGNVNTYGGVASDLTDSDGYAEGYSKRNNYGNPESITGYFVLFDSDDISNATMAYVSETITASTGNTLGQNANFAFGDVTATQTAANWTAIPEPTSGLLMLVGLAGLALRRRRA